MPDRRVHRTKASLHDALLGLAREKPYPSIAVKEILDRANVGKSTFYTHFRDKDDLLESGIHEILETAPDQSGSRTALERIVAFSLPLLKHIDDHRRLAGPQMNREGRAAMHRRMQAVLTDRIANELALMVPRSSNVQIPIRLIALHVASTFVLVLNWWVENASSMTPADVDGRFRALVVPALAKLFTDAH
jgi:AcrR family transcriptional regulator